MSWRFRQSFKIIPGVRLNLSKSGLSASIGGAPFTINAGPRGVYGTASIPGTGLSFRERLTDKVSNAPSVQNNPVAPSGSSQSASQFSASREIRSASTEVLTSAGLQELKKVIQTAYQEHEDIRQQLSKANSERDRAIRRYSSWERGFLFKNIFKKSFEVRRAEAEIAKDRSNELAEQFRLTTVATHFDLAQDQANSFFKLRDDFAFLTECSTIWNIDRERTADKVRERTNVDKAITRKKVVPSLRDCDLIQWDQQVPHFSNSTGGDLFIYPGFILYRAARMAFSVIDSHDVKLSAAKVSFNEIEAVPPDSKTIGQTWAKVNKDGTRDRRFVENYQIPIVLYGQITFTSGTGLEEMFLFSDAERMLRFKTSWDNFIASFQNNSACAILPQQKTPYDDVKFQCPQCGQHMVVCAENRGQEFQCPTCNMTLTVPSD